MAGLTGMGAYGRSPVPRLSIATTCRGVSEGGAVGLILGTIRLPALLRILRMDPRVAAGTNLFIGFIMGSMGWAGHLVQGHVDYPLLALMASGAMVGSYFGAKFTGRVTLEALIATTGWVMVVVGVILLWQAFR